MHATIVRARQRLSLLNLCQLVDSSISERALIYQGTWLPVNSSGLQFACIVVPWK
jgi:hypothetical protein